MMVSRRLSDRLIMDGSWELRRNVATGRLPGRVPVLFYSFPVIALQLAILALSIKPAASAQNTSTSAVVGYTKVLKGSIPEYEKITVSIAGAGQYDGRKLTDPPDPKSFTLPPNTVAKLFALAQSLNNFQNIDLDSHKRVADLGRKTFFYKKGNEEYQCEFNYTLNRRARDLTNLFEGLGSVERHIAAMEYSMKYDPLGLPRDLTEIEADLDQGALTEPELLAPDLKAIIQDSRFLHLAQVRAQKILDRIQDCGPPG
jgi:hypothetical protein